MAFNTPKDPKSKTFTVVIDTGHGGKDDGQTFKVLSEKEIVANITQKIKEQNTNKEIVIHLTRANY